MFHEAVSVGDVGELSSQREVVCSQCWLIAAGGAILPTSCLT
jgi:hypothetical protein